MIILASHTFVALVGINLRHFKLNQWLISALSYFYPRVTLFQIYLSCCSGKECIWLIVSLLKTLNYVWTKWVDNSIFFFFKYVFTKRITKIRYVRRIGGIWKLPCWRLFDTLKNWVSWSPISKELPGTNTLTFEIYIKYCISYLRFCCQKKKKFFFFTRRAA